MSVHLSGHVYFCRINPERGIKSHCFRLALHSLAVQVHTYPRSRGMPRGHFLQRQTLLSGENPPLPRHLCCLALHRLWHRLVGTLQAPSPVFELALEKPPVSMQIAETCGKEGKAKRISLRGIKLPRKDDALL